MKEELIKNLKAKYGDRFNISENRNKKLSDLIFHEKTYDEPIFNIYILLPDDKVLDRLKDWKETLNNEYIKHYIFSPENKEGEVIRYVSLMSENIFVSIYNNKYEIIL